MPTSPLTAAAEPPRGALHVSLWIVQVLLAGLFGIAGLFKATTPIPDLVAAGMGFAADLPRVARVAGISEVLGAVGLILPSALRIQPRLTAAAAAGLMVVMILAAVLHILRGELEAVPPTVLIGGLAAFVAWGRSAKAPIPPKA